MSDQVMQDGKWIDADVAREQEMQRLREENERLKAENERINKELDSGDSWAWIRQKFEKCGQHLRWFKPRSDNLAGTRYEVMGWLHVLFAEAHPHVYIDIALEHQKKADDLKRENAALKAQIERLKAPTRKHLGKYFITGGRQYRFTLHDVGDLENLVDELIAARASAEKEQG